MRLLVSLLAWFLRAVFTSRRSLALENLALRQQLATYARTQRRARLKGEERAFWLALSKVWQDWRSVLVLVKPATVIAWHRRGYQRYWTWKCGKPGRPQCLAAHRALQPDAARGSAQPLHIPRCAGRPARVPGVCAVLQLCAAVTGVACDTGAVPGAGHATAKDRQAARLVRAWWRAARLSPGGVDGRQHQRLFGTPAAAGWMVCEPFRHQRTGLSQSATLAASPGLGTGLTSAQPLRAGRRASIIAEYATDSRLSRLVQPSDLPGGRKSRPLHHRQLATSQPTRPPPPPHWPLRGYGPSCAARPLLAHCPQLATHLPRTTRRTHPR